MPFSVAWPEMDFHVVQHPSSWVSCIWSLQARNSPRSVRPGAVNLDGRQDEVPACGFIRGYICVNRPKRQGMQNMPLASGTHSGSSAWA